MNGSIMNVDCCERGLLWMWSVMKMVCNEPDCNERVYYERGLLWTWSVMNMVCHEHAL